jgi:hypothetical protein
LPNWGNSIKLCFIFDLIVQLQEKIMAEYTDMTDEEYDALDEEMTRNEVKLGPNGSGWLEQREMRLMGLNNMAVNYLITKAAKDHKTPAQLINELVSKEIAAATA